MTNRIILLGMSADPLHLGHAAYIKTLREHYPDDYLVLMPCKTNPLGKVDELGNPVYSTDPEERYNMLVLFKDSYYSTDEKLLISRYELDKDTPSYTWDTINYLRHFPLAHAHQDTHNNPIVLAIGSDNFLQFHRWSHWRDILAETDIVVMRRSGYPLITADMIKEDDLKQAFIHYTDVGKIQQLDGPQCDISSTYIRKRLREGADWSEMIQLIPEVVAKYIFKNR